jgi:23S rRNA G2445 N2-methylase RlmL
MAEEIENLHYSEDRDDRVKETAEVFTPSALVQEMLNSLNIDWANPPQDKTFLDPTCGSGNFLVEIAKRGIPIQNVFGLDLMHDNVETTKRRLREIYADSEDLEYHLERNIVQGDATTDAFDFYEKPDGLDDW